MLKTFALCNQAKFSYIDEDHFHATSYANEEEVLLKLISSVNWNIRIFRVGYVETGLEVSPDPFDPTKGAVRKREWVRYERRLNSFQVRRKLFSVVVENEEKITLYCKGSADDMIERLRDR